MTKSDTSTMDNGVLNKELQEASNGWIEVKNTRKRRGKQKYSSKPIVEQQCVNDFSHVDPSFDPTYKSDVELLDYAKAAVKQYRTLNNGVAVEQFIADFSLWDKQHFEALEDNLANEIREVLQEMGAFMCFEKSAAEELYQVANFHGTTELDQEPISQFDF